MAVTEDDVTVVITACGRPDLLKKTIESFLEHNTYPIYEWIINEDSGIPNVNADMKATYPTFTWIDSPERRGQIQSIDTCYSRVKTPYIFHLEDDWETYRGGYIESSLEILKAHPKVSAVMCREHSVRVYEMSDIPPILKSWGGWGYWSFNPGLRRLSDYTEHFPNGYNAFVTYDSKDPLKGEFFINNFYSEKGYRMALASHPEGYLRHIGDGRHIRETIVLPGDPKIGLCMIVKNESHIIHEALECTLPLIDTFCITDTGSTDNTVELIYEFYRKKQVPGVVCHDTWRDFGSNRTAALKNCDGKMDYILVIDADDLITFPADGKRQLLDLLRKETPNNAIIQIRQSDLKYNRAQIFKANDGWLYRGVLHEYPTNDRPNNRVLNLPNTFWMESRRLGDRNKVGDKMQRDIQVLLKGIENEPDNERYVFYLAQSYRDAGDVYNALKYYKKRYVMDRWIEEKWFSAYQVGMCHKQVGNIPSFEKWMNIAYTLRPSRAEPLYHLSRVFRERGEHYKAYHYIELGRNIPESTDSLFVETYAYRGGFDYEASIVEFYINSARDAGLRSSIRYLLKQDMHMMNVLSNLHFYMKPIRSTITPLLLDVPFQPFFRPSAISFGEGECANVRFVNYKPPTDGNYATPDGRQIRTENAYMNLVTGKVIAKMQDDITIQQLISGYEDVRLFKEDGEWRFFACSGKNATTNHINMVRGDYNIEAGRMENTQIVESPTKSLWEKNWLPIPGTDQHIYHWAPFKIGRVDNGVWTCVREVSTPPLFSLFRGSAGPIKVGSAVIAMAHIAEYGNPRKYFHLFVDLDPVTYTPRRVSLPFIFRTPEIEYCLSMRFNKEKIECLVSFMDANPHRATIDPVDIEWLDL
jgi:glycosyltransferase involved in cell wall biosynthesis